MVSVVKRGDDFINPMKERNAMNNTDERYFKELDDCTFKEFLEIVSTGYGKEQSHKAQFNVIDELHANENAHTRILVSLLKIDHVRRSFLRMIRRHLEKMIGDKSKNIMPKDILSEALINNTTSDEVKAFSQYVDAQIVHQNLEKSEIVESVAIIIENKIKGAVDQERQLERYIGTIKSTYSIDQSRVIVIYLTLRGEKDAAEYSLSETYKNKLYAYMPLSYQQHIIPWLERELCFSLEQIVNEPYLSSGITQYIHHLNGLIGKRPRGADMFGFDLSNKICGVLEKVGVNPYLALARVNFEIGRLLDENMLPNVAIGNNKLTKPILRQWLRRKFYWQFNKVVSDDDNGTYIDDLDNYALAMYNAYDGQPGDLLYVDFFFENGDVSKYVKRLKEFKRNLDEEGTGKINYWDELTYNNQKYIRVFVSTEEQLNVLFGALPLKVGNDRKAFLGNQSSDGIPYKLESLGQLRNIFDHYIDGLDESAANKFSDSKRTTYYAYRNKWAWQRAPWNGYGEAEIQVFPRNHGDEKDLICHLANNPGFPTRRFWWNGRVVIAFPLKDLEYERRLLSFLGNWKHNGKMVLEGISISSDEWYANKILHDEVVSLLNEYMNGWTVDEDSKCVYSKCREASMVRYLPPRGAKVLPDGVGIYCVFDAVNFHGCEIAAWQENNKRNVDLRIQSEEEKTEWHIGDKTWPAWRGIWGGNRDAVKGDEYAYECGMAWSPEFFCRMQCDPEFKRAIVEDLANSILKLYEILTA